MKKNRPETAGILVVVILIAFSLFFLRDKEADTVPSEVETDNTEAVLSAEDIGRSTKVDEIDRLVISDEAIGEGPEVKVGDTIDVNYVAVLAANAQPVDKSDTPFTFTVGEGKVIEGWDRGIVGMKVGGRRVLLIPPDLAYGDRVVGPIPANSHLAFTVELLAIR